MKKFTTLILSAAMLPLVLSLPACNRRGSALEVNKTEFFAGEEIYTTVKYSVGTDCWVGLFLASDRTDGKVDPIRWYYADRDGWWLNTTYGLQKSGWNAHTRPRVENIPAGDYKVVLFGDSGYSQVKETVNITVKQEKLPLPAAPTAFSYVLDDQTDGLANGTLSATFDPAAPADELILYWADDNGPLESYTAFSTIKAANQKETVHFTENTIVPKEATRLLAYSKNNAGVSETYAEAQLPAGCGYEISDPISEFQVCSDIHINLTIKLEHQQHFASMCDDVVQNSPKSDGIFVAGDIADTGNPSEWAKLFEIANERSGLPEFYFSMGNHDSYGGAFAFPTFLQYAKSETVYYDRTVNGYHHVFLGQETVGNYADMSEAQLAWLDTKLGEFTAEDKKKPVFVYLHQSLYDTVAGSLPGQDWNGVVQEEELRAILKKYSQVVLFNGHSHWDLNSYRNMKARGGDLPTIFNTSSVGYLWESFYAVRYPDDYSQTGNYLEGSQGYYVKTYDDRFLVLGRDFVSHKWIPSACYCVAL